MFTIIWRSAILALAACAFLALSLNAFAAEVLTPEGVIATGSDMGQTGHLKRGAAKMRQGADMLLKGDPAGMQDGFALLLEGHAMMKKAKMFDWGGKKMKKAADKMKSGADLMMQPDGKGMENGRKLLLSGMAMMDAGQKRMMQ